MSVPAGEALAVEDRDEAVSVGRVILVEGRGESRRRPADEADEADGGERENSCPRAALAHGSLLLSMGGGRPASWDGHR